MCTYTTRRRRDTVSYGHGTCVSLPTKVLLGFVLATGVHRYSVVYGVDVDGEGGARRVPPESP